MQTIFLVDQPTHAAGTHTLLDQRAEGAVRLGQAVAGRSLSTDDDHR
ncbi:hypothetical protein [Micromonospora sp. NPDC048830]